MPKDHYATARRRKAILRATKKKDRKLRKGEATWEPPSESCAEQIARQRRERTFRQLAQFEGPWVPNVVYLVREPERITLGQMIGFLRNSKFLKDDGYTPTEMAFEKGFARRLPGVRRYEWNRDKFDSLRKGK